MITSSDPVRYLKAIPDSMREIIIQNPPLGLIQVLHPNVPLFRGVSNDGVTVNYRSSQLLITTSPVAIFDIFCRASILSRVSQPLVCKLGSGDLSRTSTTWFSVILKGPISTFSFLFSKIVP